MSSIRQKKLMWVFATLLGATIAVLLIIYAIREQTDFYFDPSMIAAGDAPQNKRIRAGGIVVLGSVKRQKNNPLNVNFKITDCQSTISVEYEGILPDLFSENSGIVATGMLKSDIFVATEVLAKHDENYMPPEVAKSMKKNDAKIESDICATVNFK